MADRETRDPEAGGLMSFGDHLDELRRRVFLAVAVPIPIAVVVFFFSDWIRWAIERPLLHALDANGLSDQLQLRTVTELMGVDIKLSLVLGAVLSSPWIVWQVWKFIEPGLYEHERRFARLLVPGSFLLSIAGILTLYFALLPISLHVLVTYGLQDRGAQPPALAQPVEGADAPFRIPFLDEPPKEAAPGQLWILKPRPHQLNIMGPNGEVLTTQLARDTAYLQQFVVGEYVDLVLLMTLGIAVAFQMPLVILLLGWVGIVSGETLRAKRLHALFVLTIVAAVVTPTSDIATMLLMTVPLYLLYELGLVLLIAVPPQAVREGTIVRGFFRRIREAQTGRRQNRSGRGAQAGTPSGKAPARTAPPTSQTDQPERQSPSAPPSEQTAAPDQREPDGDADEEARGSGST